jgi:hypothetical protein
MELGSGGVFGWSEIQFPIDVSDLLLRTIRKGILNDSREEVVSCKPLNGLSGCKKLVSGKGLRKKKRQIRNYEIKHKTSDECESKEKNRKQGSQTRCLRFFPSSVYLLLLSAQEAS